MRIIIILTVLNLIIPVSKEGATVDFSKVMK